MTKYASVPLRAITTVQRRIRDYLFRLASGFLGKSLQNLLLVTLGLIFLFNVMALAVGVSTVIYRAELDSWRTRHMEAAQAATQTLSLFLDRARQILVNVSLLEPDANGELTRIMQQILEQERSGTLLEVVRVDHKGEILGSAYRDAPVLANLVTIQQSGWFQSARTSEMYLGNIQISSDKSPYLIMAVSSPDSGVVAARLDMQILWHFVAGIHFGRTGHTYIVNSLGRIIAHPDTAPVLANLSLVTRSEFVAFQQALDKEWSGTYTNFQGDNVFGVMISLPGTDWIAITEILVAEVYRTIRIVLLVMGIGTLVVSIVTMMILVPMLNWQIFRPLQNLCSSAERIGQGHLDERIALHWQNEIGQVLSSFNAMASRLRDRDDQIATRTTDLAAEIVERQRAEDDARRLLQQTQAQALQMEQIMNTVPEGVLCLSSDYHILLANSAARSHLPIIAGDISDNMLEHLGGQPLDTLLQLVSSEACWQEVAMAEAQSIFEVTARPLGINGEIDGWVLVVRDVSQERQRQIALQTQERLASVGELAAGIAHDFNNILTPILIYSEMVAMTLPESHRNHQNMLHVLTAVGRAKELVSQILVFARQGPQRERKPVLLQPLVEEALKLLRAALPSTIRIQEQIDPNSGTVAADPTQILQILINLCTNAQHSMREHGGVLTIGLDEVAIDADLVATHSNLHVGIYVCLNVSDTGHGMTPEIRARIFDPFFSTKGVGEGTGMGLAVVHGIVMDHGGDILVESWPGEGASFQIYLPRATSEAGGDEEVHGAEQVRGTGHILLLDDEKTLGLAVQQSLEKLGYSVTYTSRSSAAVEIFRSKPSQFDLVITDLTMPEMTGTEVAQELLRIRPDVPILLITGYSGASAGEQVQQHGIRATLMKPFSTGDLSRKVAQILSQIT